jgi:hypothetical protein
MKKLAIGTLLSLLLMASPTFAQDENRPALSDGTVPRVNVSKKVRRFVVPLILAAGNAANGVQITFDTTIFMTYTPGLARIPQGPGATVDVYLFDDSAVNPLRSANGHAVCQPCTFPLGPASRSQSIRIDDLITASGAFDAGVKLGFAVIVVGGSDPDGVNLRGRVVGSHAGSFELSVFGFEPQPIAAEAQ